MIVDDSKLIIGSANLNDRSLLGVRDSELAIIIEPNSDADLVDRMFAGKFVKVHPFVRRFRRSLMAEYLGLIGIDDKNRGSQLLSYAILADPVCDNFFHKVWNETAKTNEKLFDEIFHCVPGPGLRTFKDCAIKRKKKCLFLTDNEKALELLHQIRGYLIPFPSDFLADESLVAPVGTVERILPDLLWI